jgi:hypothetical protein
MHASVVGGRDEPHGHDVAARLGKLYRHVIAPLSGVEGRRLLDEFRHFLTVEKHGVVLLARPVEPEDDVMALQRLGWKIELLADPEHTAALQAELFPLARKRDCLPVGRVEVGGGPSAGGVRHGWRPDAILFLPGGAVNEKPPVVLLLGPDLRDLCFRPLADAGQLLERLKSRPGLGGRAADGAEAQSDGNLQFLVQLPPEEISNT